MSLEAKCPVCGGAIEWKLGDSLVVVCTYCRSAIARADRALSDLGKVADLVDNGTVLQLGLTGLWKGVHFTLVGHGQMAHPAGGSWDEWYASFSDGRWGWLAEAQGQLYMTFRGHAPAVPEFDRLEVGGVAFDQFVVSEKGRARALGAEGELPFAWKRDAEWDFADLGGPAGVFGTLDYSEDAPAFFVGRLVTLDELGVPVSARRVKPEATHIKALELACPNCHGPLALRAPDSSLRVTCPSCNGLLDVEGGKLSYLRALEKPDIEPTLALGTSGVVKGERYTVLGYMRRGVTVDGVSYRWSEYLLSAPRVGFRWLVESKGHWSFVEPVPAGDVVPSWPAATFDGKTFKAFQRGSARVLHVLGEFYWRVQAGETVGSADYIAPPLMLSSEKSKDEIIWSLGTYVAPGDIARGFAVKKLPTRSGVGANQAFWYDGVISLWPKMLLLAIVAWVLVLATRHDRVIFEQTFTLDAVAAAAPSPAPPPTPEEGSDKTATMVVFTEPLPFEGHQSLEVSVVTNVVNSWVGLDGDVIDEATGEVNTFGVPVEFYRGFEDGEGWAEGSQTGTTRIPAVRAGEHTMRLELQWEKSQPSELVTVTVRQGSTSFLQLLAVLFALSLFPIFVLMRRSTVETQRWEDADFTQSGRERSAADDSEDEE